MRLFLVHIAARAVVPLIAAASVASSQTFLFDYYNVSNGLPSNWITSMCQDSRGYLWVGCDGGLAVYDGVSFKAIGTAEGLPVPLVWSVIEDRFTPGTMYAGTYLSGLSKLQNGKITNIALGNTDASNTIATLLQDRSGVIWCGTGKGVYRVQNDSGKLFPTGTDTGFVTILHETRNGSILFGFDSTLYEYSPSPSGLKRLDFGASKFFPRCVSEDSNGTMWLGTSSGAILKIINGKATARLQTHFRPLFSVVADKGDNLWFASDSGLIKVSKKNFPNDDVVQITPANGLQDRTLIFCAIDREDNLWIGSRGNGLAKLAYRNIVRFRVDGVYPDILNKTVVADSSGHVFVAARNRLIEFWKSAGGNWQRYAHQTQPLPVLANTSVNAGTSIDIAPNGVFWGTFGQGGLQSFAITPRQGQHSVLQPRTVVHIGKDLPTGPPLGIAITKDNQLWYNIRPGPLVQFDIERQRMVTQHVIGGEASVGGGTAQSLCAMPNGDIWIGRYTGGLVVLSPDGKNYSIARVITEKDGLAGDRVRSIVRRHNGDIWIGTRFDGISIYRNGKFQTLGAEHGLQNNAVWKMVEDEDRRMWVGTSIGVQYTEPDGDTLFRHPRLSGEQVSSIGFVPGKKTIWTLTNEHLTLFEYGQEHEATVAPLVSIAGLRINGIDRALTNDQTFSHSENFCVIRFSGISHKDPGGLQFRYRLLGLDTLWHEPTAQRNVTFASLGSGRYTFEVQAMTADGIRSEDAASISFTILPPWYLSPWTIGAYVVLGSLFVFSYIKLRTRKLERRSTELERIVAERTAEIVAQRNRLHEQAERLSELDIQKSHFFANISHEFRTPLTVILGHLDRLMKKDGAEQVKDYSIMDRNARRLLQFINQLLDLSKIEAGGMTLRASNTDIVAFIRRTTASLSSYAQHKGIDLTFNGAAPESMGQSTVFVYFDHDKIEKVMVNLISNALKFTPHGGSVDVSLSSGIEDKNVPCAEIVVKDTGTGIPAAKLPYVFDRFYQVEDYTRPGYEGTGIGLALVKELVELHHGSVSVESTEGKGTTFSVRLPLGTTHLDEGEIVANAGKQEAHDLKALPEIDLPIPEESVGGETSDESRVLVVEDNADLRSFICEQLASELTIIQAANGKEGLRKAEDFMPDIIISDIMMPEMDGYALCKEIKTNEKTSHIPVILLTAKATTENKLEGLELGADDYLMKPFNPQELQVRVRNLIQIRKQLREKFSSEMLLKPTEVTVPSQQKVFLERVTAVIEKHLSEEEFSVETLADEIGMSRSQLHRKLKSLTNKVPNELIRSFRLQRAAELIKQDAGSLAEIAYQVGFGSQAYFTRSFSEEFGVSPSEYRKNNSQPSDAVST